MARREKTDYRNADSPLLTAVPADFDGSIHSQLTLEDFEESLQYLYWDYREEYFQQRADHAKQQSVLFRTYSKKEQRDKVLKVERMKEQLEALQRELVEVEVEQ